MYSPSPSQLLAFRLVFSSVVVLLPLTDVQAGKMTFKISCTVSLLVRCGRCHVTVGTCYITQGWWLEWGRLWLLGANCLELVARGQLLGAAWLLGTGC